MYENKVKNSIKVIVTVTYLLMVLVNVLANTLPINGQQTGEVSDSYPNLFAPSGLTFAIWGLIYFLLACFTLSLLGFFQGGKNNTKARLLNKIGILFSISSIANAAWIFAWHYNQILLCMLLMICILVCLILINQQINQERLSTREKFFIRLPFRVYFGWITVATIANATTLLVSLGWNGFGLPEPFWAVAIIIVGMLIGSATMIRNRDAAYGLVLIWAYAGIWLKHTSPDGFAGQYPAVIITTVICIIVFVICEAYLLFSKKRR